MISFHTISGGGDATHYYAKSFDGEGVERGVDNYYAHEKANLTWGGKAAEMLGISGETATPQDFRDKLEGRLVNPITGEMQDLSQNSRGDSRRLGYDLTMAPPKSVSIMALVGNDDRIVDAHVKANETALKWLEEYAGLARVSTPEGKQYVHTENLLWASTLHQVNRDNEPHLHTHNVVIAATYEEGTGKWYSLTNDNLLKLRRTADRVYMNELGNTLTKLGYNLKHNEKGSFEIEGLSKEQIAGFSERRQEIESFLLDKWGVSPDEATVQQRAAAALKTRSAKVEKERDELQAEWNETAQRVGIDPQTLIPKNGANIDAIHDGQEKRAGQAVQWAISHLAEREQSFARGDLVDASLGFVRGKTVDHRALETAIDNAIKKNTLISTGEPHVLTTAEARSKEQSMIAYIDLGKDRGNTVLSTVSEFDAALSSYEAAKSNELGSTYKLSEEQVQAAKNILLHPDQFQGINGDAGTGKTAMLAFVKEVAEARGWEVIGMATSAAATKELEHSSGITSQTVAKFNVANDQAIAKIEREIKDIKGALIRDGYLEESGLPRMEQEQLLPAGTEKVSTYTFDHMYGDVYKTPENLRNKTARLLLNLADRGMSQDESVAGYLDKAKNGVYSQIRTVGQALTTYEAVSMAEANEAKAALTAMHPNRDSLLAQMADKEAELINRKRTGNARGSQMLFVMDEASLTGVGDTERLFAFAAKTQARLVLQGDVKQHGSVAAGEAFRQAQDAGLNTSTLTETRRFNNATPQTQSAVMLMSNKAFKAGVQSLDRIELKKGEDLARIVANNYLQSMDELAARGVERPAVGIVTMTNHDRKLINQAVHAALLEKGALQGQEFEKSAWDDPKLTGAERRYAAVLLNNNVDALVFRKDYESVGIKKNETVRVIGYDIPNNIVHVQTETGRHISIDPQKQDLFSPGRIETRRYAAGDQIEARDNLRFGKETITNGSKGVIKELDDKGVTVMWRDKGGIRELRLSNEQMRGVDHAYAHTSYKEQGATNDREIIAVSESGAKIFGGAAAYVAASRAKDNTVLITSSFEDILKNVSKESEKSLAVERGDIQRMSELTGTRGKTVTVRATEKAKERIQENLRNLDGVSRSNGLERTIEPSRESPNAPL